MQAEISEIDSAYAILSKFWNSSNSRKKIVRDACNGIINPKTLAKWLGDRAVFDRAYSKTEIVAVAKNMRSKKVNESVSAYGFMLSQLKKSAESLNDLMKIAGTYQVYHDIPDLKFEEITFRVYRNPNSIFFAFLYSCGGQSGYCDGMVFENNGKTILAGLSHNAMSIARFGKFSPDNDGLLFGNITIDDSLSGNVHNSNIVLVLNDAENVPENIENINIHNCESYRQLQF